LSNPAQLQRLQRALDYAFERPALLTQALTHRSFGAANNERLEFLGDSVLNCSIAHALYQAFPDLPEGSLSRLRANLVRQETLAEMCGMSRISAARTLRRPAHLGWVRTHARFVEVVDLAGLGAL
jgi:ribonuclease-3